MTPPVRLGIVGVGYMGRLHLQKALAHPQVEVVGVYDVSAEALAWAAQMGVSPASSYEELLNRCEALIIASPTATHTAYAAAALRAGKHILVEKPITPTLAELESLILLWEEAGVVAIVGHIERFNPAFQALLPYRNRLSVYHFERVAPWTPRGTDASVVMDLLIHDLDLFWTLTEGHIADLRVSAYRLRTFQADTIQVWIDLVDGRGASFTASRVAPHKRRRILAHGPSLWAEANLLEKSLHIWSLRAEADPIPLSVALSPQDALTAELEHFLHCIYYRTPSTLSLEYAYSVMAWAHQVETMAERRLAFSI